MISKIEHTTGNYTINLNQAIDISIPLIDKKSQVKCFYAPDFKIEAVIAGDFIGDTQQGGLLNFKNIFLNPHGNGTHTECVGHIAKKWYSINQCLKQFFFLTELITVEPILLENGDRVILKEQIIPLLEGKIREAVVIRTLPNPKNKLTFNYSGTNPIYLHHEAATFLVDQNIQHLLIDLPSVDREEDEGALLAHKAFWQYPSDRIRTNCTISELIFVPNEVKDGCYMLNLQIISLEMDVSPSKPLLYKILESTEKS